MVSITRASVPLANVGRWLAAHGHRMRRTERYEEEMFRLSEITRRLIQNSERPRYAS